MTYDKAKYHLEGDFPTELPSEQAYLHEGMFLGWACEKGILSDEFCEDFEDEISKFKRGEIKRGAFFRLVGGVLADDMFSVEALPFLEFYYGEDKRYYADYATLFFEYPTLYHVEDSLENFRRICALLDDRFENGQQTP